MNVDPTILKGNERRERCHRDVEWRWGGVESHREALKIDGNTLKS